MDNASDHAARLSPIPPPRKRGRYIKLLRAARGGAELRGICLNQDIEPVWAHWCEALDAKVRCSGTPECRFCPFLPKPRWYGYMPVFVPTTGRISCFEITVEGARECPQMNGKRVPLRGKQLTIFRIGKGKFGQGRARIEEFRELHLPPAENMKDLLDSLFGPDEMNFDHREHSKPGKELAE